MRKFSLIIGIALLLFSCVPQKDVVYLQGSDLSVAENIYENVKTENKIKIFDQVYIQVSSFDDGKVNFMSNDQNRYGGGRSEADLAMVAFTVDKDGSVKLPIVGKTKIEGLTTEAAAEKIRSDLERYLNTPSVRISFVNKSVTVLGTVNKPGRYFYASEYLSVFQALGLAGDIQEYGNRREVVIIRDKQDKVTYKTLNLTDVHLLAHEDLYVQPDDVLYVQPLKRRHWGFQSFPWALVLSSVTTVILVANYVEK
ncbi:polysaccharide biosynthesis/export family protein [Labilibacter marinus]|uniref:polysaccharide biosynthesis/export family protein n=1 Tax=Labilibacter marinus TaxID=1477105 RepID=UPI00094F6FA7|nr:polysaccharide biosynthesis/export family protein [Labilibacter marinus]